MIKLILALTAPLLFAVGWLIAQHSLGRKRLVKIGLISIVLWFLGAVIWCVVVFFGYVGAVVGPTPDNFNMIIAIVFGVGVVWIFGIIPYLLLLRFFDRRKDVA